MVVNIGYIMAKNNWLNGEPDIRNGLMCSGKYSYERDDTEYVDVYSYPNLKYIGRYNSSRFNNPGHVQERYPKLDSYGFRTVGSFQVWRDLFPNMNENGEYLERICWGHPDMITHAGGGDLSWHNSITSHPQDFNEIVEIVKKYGRL